MPTMDARTRQQNYRLRQQRRRVLVSIEVGPAEVEALRRLELLPHGDANKTVLSGAVQQFLSCAPAVADIPRKLYLR